MNYTKIYNQLIERAQTRELNDYTEKHHIVPRCLGGSDEAANLVALTPEEHYVAHQLLVKMHPGNRALLHAAVMMQRGRQNNKLYGWLRRKFSAQRSKDTTGSKNPSFGTKWICNIELQENKKIVATDDIPAGWVAGRNKWNCKVVQRERMIVPHVCKHCGIETAQRTFCSDKCRLYNRSPAIQVIDKNLEAMLQQFAQCNSINAVLESYGLFNRAGNKYFSDIVKQNGLQVLRRRNTS